ncbi:MAG: ComEA family DNA-binding protein [Lysobacterales bacterium]
MNTFKALLLSLLFVFATAVQAGPVNINTASAEQLTELNGIGLVKAQAIVAYREQNGAFKSADQLANVKGIGLKTVEKNRANIAVAAAKPAVASTTPAQQP